MNSSTEVIVTSLDEIDEIQEITDKPVVDEMVFDKSEKSRILRNIIVMSLAFMMHFTAFQGAANLQSSLNPEAGTPSLAAIYAALIFSSTFLPVALINWIGVKLVMAFSMVCYMPYIAAQFYPSFATLIPAGLLVGLGAGPLWCAQCTYLTVIADRYSDITKIPSSALVIRFFGIFFMIFQLCQIWGNLISSLVFSSHIPDSIPDSETIRNHCGARFDPRFNISSNSNMEKPPEDLVDLVAVIYLICIGIAFLTIIFGIDALTRYDQGRTGSGTGISGMKLLYVTLQLVKEKELVLLIPITMFMGVSQAYMGADYTKSFVSCAWGISKVGYVMICYGVCNSISALILGWLVKYTGRLPVIVSTCCLNIAVLIVELLWRPSQDESYMFFVISGLWGVGDGVWLAQINAYYGILFRDREEAAYGNFRLWESVGYIVAYLYSPYLATYIKIYILLAILIVGTVLYIVTEIMLRRKEADKGNN